MQHITQTRSLPQWESRFPSFRLRPYLLVVFVLVTGLTVINIGARALAEYTMPPSNPFSSFADIFPGQPRNALETRGFSCSIVPYSDIPNEYCYFYPTTGAFSKVSVLVSKDVIRITSFILSENALNMGDLMLLWGKPLSDESSSWVHFLSHKIVVTAFVVDHTRQLSPFLRVLKVIITNPPT